MIAMIAWASLALTFHDYFAAAGHDIPLALWRIGFYYTHFATLIVAIVFSGIALNVRRLDSSLWVGKTVIVFGILVVHYWTMQGPGDFVSSQMRSKAVHGLLPALIALFWLGFAEHRRLRWRDALVWTIFPILYTTYGLTRGVLTGAYPYSAGDIGRHGLAFVMMLVVLTTLASLLAGFGLVALDRRLPTRRPFDRRPGPPSAARPPESPAPEARPSPQTRP